MNNVVVWSIFNHPCSGAKRDAKKKVRRDIEYVRKLKAEEREKLDAGRREKTKRILGQLANQEGDVKKSKFKSIKLFPDI